MSSEIINAIVLKNQEYGANDMLLTLFTAEKGKIVALARGAKGSNRSMLYCQPFAYSEFMLYRGRSIFTINHADLIEPFYNLRSDITASIMSYYLNELVLLRPGEVVTGEEQAILKLLLNALHFICVNPTEDNVYKVKMAFEIQYAVINGYAPNLSACIDCGSTEPGSWFFDDGERCPECSKNHQNGHLISVPIQQAMNHILNHNIAAASRFMLTPDTFRYMKRLIEKYMSHIFETEFSMLRYYNSLFEV